MSDSKRPLLKGPLRQPRSKPVVLSYAEPRRSRHEVTASARDGSIKGGFILPFSKKDILN